MPHAVIVSPNPTNKSGGVERVCALLAQALQQHGWRTDVVGPGRPPTQWEYRLGTGYASMSCSAMQAAHALAPDIIVTNGYLGYGHAREGSLLRPRVKNKRPTTTQRGKTPRLHLYHGTMVGAVRALGDLITLRERIRRAVGGGIAEAVAGRGATRAVCVSDATADEVRRCYRLKDIEVIPNGIDDVTFAPGDQLQARACLDLDSQGRYAAFVGRFEPGKGAQLALDAAIAAGYELLVVGPAAPASARHLGTMAPGQLPDVYAAADCVILPSRYEACSMVVLEALACARPLITTRVGWMDTLVRAVPGYRALCIEGETTVEGVRARMEALPDIDTALLTAQARSYIIEHNSMTRWSQRWHELAASVVSDHPVTVR